MCDQGLEDRVEDYFSSLNSMARRMLVDTTTIKQQLGTAWDKLAYEDQCRILTDGIVKPKVREKYSYYPHEKPDVDSFPKLLIRSGEKYVIDEDAHGKGSGYTWRDEHSGPFTWQTQSQLDLTLAESHTQQLQQQQPCPLLPKNLQSRINTKQSSPDLAAHRHGSPAKEDSAPKLTPRKNRPQRKEPPIEPAWKQPIVQQEPQTESITEVCVATAVSKIEDMNRAKQLESESLARKLQPTVRPTHKNVEQLTESKPESLNDAQEDDPDIPRTGFDFLDNW